MNFTKTQLAAINHTTGNLQLIACAGSGKTEVVARRVATLLKAGAKPSNIIAFTFTDKAAAELKERIITRCREELGHIHGMAEMYVGTIHAFCLELLKSEVPKFLKFDVLNEVQQSLFIDRFSNKTGLTTSTDLTGNALKRYRDTPHYLSATTILREAELELQKLAKCSVVKGLDAYRVVLEENNYFDYSAIMEAAVEVLTTDVSLRKRLADRIQHVIVDEYQDVNPIQEAIISSLHKLGSHICVVGDDDQTIYQWRGSNVQGILTFQQRYPKVTPVKLEENFRSSNGIVETARVFIEQNASVCQKQCSRRMPRFQRKATSSRYHLTILIKKRATSRRTSWHCAGQQSKTATPSEAFLIPTWPSCFAAFARMARPLHMPLIMPKSPTSSSA